MSEWSEEGDGLDTGASDVISQTEGELKPMSKGREHAARGGVLRLSKRQQKSRSAAAGRHTQPPRPQVGTRGLLRSQ
jgi:hypothetical protein